MKKTPQKLLMSQKLCGPMSDPGTAVGDLPFLLKQQKTIWNARKNGIGGKNLSKFLMLLLI